MKLLIIEDDKNLSNVISEHLGKMFDIDKAFDGAEGLYYAEQGIYDIIVLDIMLPEMDGYTVLQELRAKDINTPVLLLTAKDSIDDKVKGFESGADDYLVKPFHREELILRIEAILRRYNQKFSKNELTFNEITLNLDNRTVLIVDQILELPGKQFDILEYFISNQEIILTKEQVFNRIWGFDSDTTTNVIEVYTSNLRKNLKPFGCDHYIKTVRGIGYIFTDKGENN